MRRIWHALRTLFSERDQYLGVESLKYWLRRVDRETR